MDKKKNLVRSEVSTLLLSGVEETKMGHLYTFPLHHSSGFKLLITPFATKSVYDHVLAGKLSSSLLFIAIIVLVGVVVVIDASRCNITIAIATSLLLRYLPQHATFTTSNIQHPTLLTNTSMGWRQFAAY